MEWLVLIVLVPAIVVPLVLIFGFAGCSSFDAADPPPAPFDLEATAVSETQIDLKWKHASAGGVNFTVSRQGPDGLVALPPVAVKTLSSVGLTTGATYSYTVKADVGGIDTADSNKVTTRTLMWEVAYDKPSTAADGAHPGDCLVQRIDKAQLNYQGVARKIRLSLRGATSGGGAVLTVERVTVSHPAISTPTNPRQEWDSEPPVRFLPTAVPPLPGTPAPILLEPIDFPMDKTRDLIVAFDIANGNAGGVRKRQVADVGTSRCFIRNNTKEAGEANRTPPGPLTGPGTQGWTTQVNSVYLIEKIEVLTAQA